MKGRPKATSSPSPRPSFDSALAGSKLPNLMAVEGNIFQTDADAAIAWKKEQKDWQALSLMWGK